MTHWCLRDTLAKTGARFDEVRGIELAVDFDDSASEYQASTTTASLYNARDRALLKVNGDDRISWLHNLVSNNIKDLAQGQGTYTFALDPKGRILMDFNIIVMPNAIWIDIDRRLVPNALVHFDRYTFTEKIDIADTRDDFERIALLGPNAKQICTSLGVPQAPSMTSLSSTAVTLAEKPVLMVRHDFAGVFGVEFHVESADAPACWSQLMEVGRPVDLRPVGWRTVRTLQIEAGLPVYGEDIDEDVLPAETRQTDRAVSYTKGCYLGQEIVGKMHAQGELARTLVGLKLINPPTELPHHQPLVADGKVIGRLTSTCRSPSHAATIALGYVTTAYARDEQPIQIACTPPVDAKIMPLPFRTPTT